MLTAIPEVDLGIEYVAVGAEPATQFDLLNISKRKNSIKLRNIEETERAKRRMQETKNAPDRDPVIVAAERCKHSDLENWCTAMLPCIISAQITVSFADSPNQQSQANRITARSRVSITPTTQTTFTSANITAKGFGNRWAVCRIGCG